MTEMNHERDLWGPKAPWVGSAEGSPLNNFLARSSGRRVIVVLDEFEKTSTVVQNSLLVPFREGSHICIHFCHRLLSFYLGTFVDRRTRRQVDCSNAIWILTSNALDQIIVDFVRYNTIPCQSDGSGSKAVITKLQSRLVNGLKQHFGVRELTSLPLSNELIVKQSPVTGRISAVIPFLPFSPEEQAVIAHKFLLEFARDVRQPPVVPSRLLGNVIIHLRRDATLCMSIAEGYDVDLGAPSLQSEVISKIKQPLVLRYLEDTEKVEDDQPAEDYYVDIDENKVVEIFRSFSDIGRIL